MAVPARPRTAGVHERERQHRAIADISGQQPDMLPRVRPLCRPKYPARTEMRAHERPEYALSGMGVELLPLSTGGAALSVPIDGEPRLATCQRRALEIHAGEVP